jgi:hypothetical protein
MLTELHMVGLRIPSYKSKIEVILIVNLSSMMTPRF